MAVNPLLIDPTRTGAIRAAFLAEMNARWRRLRGAIWHLIVREDAFGISDKTAFDPFSNNQSIGAMALDYEPDGTLVNWVAGNSIVTNTRWQFLTDAEKTTAFQEWLTQQVNADILAPLPGTPINKPWMSKFMESAYMKGVTRSWQDVHKEAIAAGLQKGFVEQTQSQFLRQAFPGLVRTSKIELLSTRAFQQLKGVTGGMGAESTGCVMHEHARDHLAREAPGPFAFFAPMSHSVQDAPPSFALTVLMKSSSFRSSRGSLSRSSFSRA